MKKIVRIREGVKIREAKLKELEELPLNPANVNMMTELIQALIPIGLHYVKEVLEQEVNQIAGQRYEHQGRVGPDRWGKQWGSIYLRDQKLPIRIPRVRDRRSRTEIRLKAYERLREPQNGDEGVLKRILGGLSCRSYRACAEAVPEAFGLSSSSMSRRYIRASERQLKKLCERSLEGYEFVALIVDGKSFGTDEMVVALGVDDRGEEDSLRVCADGNGERASRTATVGAVAGTRVEDPRRAPLCD